jgi:hypothetical protein
MQTLRFQRGLLALCAVMMPLFALPRAGAEQPSGAATRIAAIKAVLHKFLVLNQQAALESPATRKLLTGEAAARWHTGTFGLLNGAPDAVVLTGPGQGVARVQWFGANGQVTDFYFYLKQQGNGWKLFAMRYLSLTGIIEQSVLALRAQATRKPEEQAQLDNMELTLACDRELRRHFLSHRAEFEQLRQQAVPGDKPSSGASRAKLIQSLHLERVDIRGMGDIDFTIGGITDNTVGYLYSSSDSPPAISPSEYIWVEKIAPRWYLYRTT